MVTLVGSIDLCHTPNRSATEGEKREHLPLAKADWA